MIKKAGLVLAFFIINSCLFADITTPVTVATVGYNSQYLEATSNTIPVFHFTINASSSGGTLTSLAVKNVMSTYYGYTRAGEPASIASGSVKVWYVQADAPVFGAGSTPQYVTFLAVADPVVDPTHTHWSNSFSLPVVDGSGIWVTIDIPLNPDFATVQFQSDGLSFDSSTVTSSDEPAMPPVLMITSSTPVNNMQAAHLSGNMQSYVSTGQQNIIATKLQFINNSGTTSAAALINSITLTIVDADSATLDPSTIISDIKIADADLGNVYGGLTSLPSSPVPLNIPLSISVPPNSTITANVIITITSALTSTLPLKQFSFVLNGPSDINCVDSYTNIPVTVSAATSSDPFPMSSTSAKIENQSLQAGFAFGDSIIPPTVNKGQTNIPLANLILNNPGNSLTAAYVQVYSLRFHLQDSYGSPVVPKDIFSKISITDPAGATTYGLKTSSGLESSGNALSMTLSNPIPVQPGPGNVTVLVSADISLSTTAQNFKIGIDSLTDIQARDANSFSPAVVSSTSGTAPYYSNLALLSSFFTVSHQQRMPPNLYSGQAGINAMTLNLTNPLPYGTGNILVRGVTLSACDASGSPVNMSDVVSMFEIVPKNTAYGPTTGTAIPASPDLYLPFAQAVTVTTGAGEAINFFFQLKSTASGSVDFLINSASSISAYQDNDLSRTIYISPAPGETFPMRSGTGYINGSSSSASFSSYPNPFHQGSACKLAYYLAADSKVTIKIFDIMGNQVRSITENSARSAGSHSENTWDGRDKNGKFVLAGTYIARIEAKGPSGTKTSTVKATFVK